MNRLWLRLRHRRHGTSGDLAELGRILRDLWLRDLRLEIGWDLGRLSGPSLREKLPVSVWWRRWGMPMLLVQSGQLATS